MRHVAGLPGGGRPGEEEALRATRGRTGQGLPPTQTPSAHLVPRLLAGRLLGSPALVAFCALPHPSHLRGSREAGGPRAALLRAEALPWGGRSRSNTNAQSRPHVSRSRPSGPGCQSLRAWRTPSTTPHQSPPWARPTPPSTDRYPQACQSGFRWQYSGAKQLGDPRMKSRTLRRPGCPSTPGPTPAVSWGEDVRATRPQLQHVGSSTFTATCGI